jgi:hypothetical protein
MYAGALQSALGGSPRMVNDERTDLPQRRQAQGPSHRNVRPRPTPALSDAVLERLQAAVEAERARTRGQPALPAPASPAEPTDHAKRRRLSALHSRRAERAPAAAARQAGLPEPARQAGLPERETRPDPNTSPAVSEAPATALRNRAARLQAATQGEPDVDSSRLRSIRGVASGLRRRSHRDLAAAQAWSAMAGPAGSGAAGPRRRAWPGSSVTTGRGLGERVHVAASTPAQTRRAPAI